MMLKVSPIKVCQLKLFEKYDYKWELIKTCQLKPFENYYENCCIGSHYNSFWY